MKIQNKWTVLARTQKYLGKKLERFLINQTVLLKSLWFSCSLNPSKYVNKRASKNIAMMTNDSIVFKLNLFLLSADIN
jgi:hypothetical protein